MIHHCINIFPDGTFDSFAFLANRDPAKIGSVAFLDDIEITPVLFSFN